MENEEKRSIPFEKDEQELLQFIGFIVECLDEGKSEEAVIRHKMEKAVIMILNAIPFFTLEKDAEKNKLIERLKQFAIKKMGGEEEVEKAKKEFEKFREEEEKNEAK